MNHRHDDEEILRLARAFAFDESVRATSVRLADRESASAGMAAIGLRRRTCLAGVIVVLVIAALARHHDFTFDRDTTELDFAGAVVTATRPPDYERVRGLLREGKVDSALALLDEYGAAHEDSDGTLLLLRAKALCQQPETTRAGAATVAEFERGFGRLSAHARAHSFCRDETKHDAAT